MTRIDAIYLLVENFTAFVEKNTQEYNWSLNSCLGAIGLSKV